VDAPVTAQRGFTGSQQIGRGGNQPRVRLPVEIERAIDERHRADRFGQRAVTRFGFDHASLA
jgi:hypothetical protein